MIVITVAFVTKKNLFWEEVPWPVQMIFLTLDILLLGMLEGVQISLVALKGSPNEAYRHTHPHAYKLSCLIHQGMNLERFLMGRQIFVVVTVFLAARMTTQKDMDDLFGGTIPEWFQVSLMNTGLLGVVVVAIFGQLTPQIVASAYPVEFMQIIPGVYYVCLVCLGFERLGLVHLCYRVADFFVWIFRIQSKEESTELLDNAITNMPNQSGGADTDPLKAKVGPNKLKALLDVMEKISKAQDVDQESQVFQLALHRYPHLFNVFPSVIGDKVYSSPQQIWSQLQQNGYSGPQPAFLRPISDPAHVPPHVYACQIIAQNHQLRQQIKNVGGSLFGLEGNPNLERAVTTIVDKEMLVLGTGAA
jgi:hypothetical protein